MATTPVNITTDPRTPLPVGSTSVLTTPRGDRFHVNLANNQIPPVVPTQEQFEKAITLTAPRAHERMSTGKILFNVSGDHTTGPYDSPVVTLANCRITYVDEDPGTGSRKFNFTMDGLPDDAGRAQTWIENLTTAFWNRFQKDLPQCTNNKNHTITYQGEDYDRPTYQAKIWGNAMVTFNGTRMEIGEALTVGTKFYLAHADLSGYYFLHKKPFNAGVSLVVQEMVVTSQGGDKGGAASIFDSIQQQGDLVANKLGSVSAVPPSEDSPMNESFA